MCARDWPSAAVLAFWSASPTSALPSKRWRPTVPLPWLEMRAASGIGLALLLLLAACAQPVPQAGPAPTSALEGVTPVGTADARLNPTESIGANTSSAVADVASVFAAVQQATQLRITANSSPPGASGPDVQ